MKTNNWIATHCQTVHFYCTKSFFAFQKKMQADKISSVFTLVFAWLHTIHSQATSGLCSFLTLPLITLVFQHTCFILNPYHLHIKESEITGVGRISARHSDYPPSNLSSHLSYPNQYLTRFYVRAKHLQIVSKSRFCCPPDFYRPQLSQYCHY